MYRAIIADDEHHVVDWITELISAAFPELELQQAGTGMEVLRLCESKMFDLAVLDIKMPGLSGIDTANKMLEKCPNSKILLLTGYDEFDLIYQVNHIKNIRYSLKTETDREIVQKLREMIAELELEQRQRQMIDSAQRKDLLIRHFEQRGILYDIIFDSSSVRSMQEKINSYGPLLWLDSQAPVYMALIHFPSTGTSRHIIENDLLLRLYRCLEEQLRQRFRMSLLDIDRDCVLLLAQATEMSGAACAADLSPELDRSMGMLDPPRRTAIRYFIYEKALSWRRIAQCCRYLLQYCRYHGPQEAAAAPVFGTVVEARASSHPSGARQKELETAQRKFSQLLQSLSSALNQNDQDKFQATLAALRRLIPSLCTMHEAQQAELRGQLALLLLDYVNLYHPYGELDRKLSLAPLYRAMSTQDWNELFANAQNLAAELFTLSHEKMENNSAHTVRKICDYINTHLSEDLSVARLSDLFNYNQSYISRLFKQMQGETLSQYLKNARIDRAKELLRNTHMSIQEIAGTVGFDTIQYFSMVFRKEVGMTPKSFRDTGA